MSHAETWSSDITLCKNVRSLKLSKTDVRPHRRLEIRILRSSGSRWLSLVRIAVVCVGACCENSSVWRWLCGRPSPVLKGVTLVSRFVRSTEGKERRLCYYKPDLSPSGRVSPPAVQDSCRKEALIPLLCLWAPRAKSCSPPNDVMRQHSDLTLKT